MSLAVEAIEVGAWRIPTDAPESDGTLAWDATTLVVVHARAGDREGLGYTYADAATARLVAEHLAPVVCGRDPLAPPAAWQAMVHATRNLGRPGLTSMAISAVDCALWDLAARLLDAPLVVMLGACHEGVMAYGSGGFTSYDDSRLRSQLEGWVAAGLTAVKIKVGRDPPADPRRVRLAREAIGDGAALFVDGNGAWHPAAAIAMAHAFAEHRVSWFEEPCTADDLDGLRRVRDHAPPGMEIAAGEYGYDAGYFRRMLPVVDCLQIDVTRCGGYTGWRRAAALADAFHVPVSAHCAPQLSAHACCATRAPRHLEYFHDHVRIERALFDGGLAPVDGRLCPDRGRAGHGLSFKRRDAERHRIG
ncbi:MAG: enolase C-terminal domain-like protein [bacterium]